MAAITAALIKQVREDTGAGMLDVKKALTEAEGDVARAKEIIRAKGIQAAGKREGRKAQEGTIASQVVESANGQTGYAVELNSETDFVAKNADFQNFVKALAEIVAEKNPADVAALSALPYEGEQTVADALRDKILVIGENLSIRRFLRYEGDCVAYVHGGGRIGVLVRFDADAAASGSDALIECGKDVAMQIAALNAQYLDKSTVPAEALAKEKEILVAQIQNDPKNANKPEAIIAKMVDGRIGKFYETNCLLQQAFVKNGDITVEQYVADQAKAAGGAMKIAEFVRFEKGEGMQKREDNFADEVASMMK